MERTKTKRSVRMGLETTAKMGIIAVLAVTFWACGGQPGSEKELRELKEGQKQLLEKVEALEKTQKRLMENLERILPKRAFIDYNKVYDIKIGHSPVRGAENAKVTLIEFSDYQCPYSRGAQPMIQALLKAYPNDLRHVFKNFPLRFHKRALPAAKAGIAAGLQGKFWEMHALLFKDPKKLEDEDLKGYAEQLGLDVAKFEADMKGKEVEKLLKEDVEEARKAQVGGTPTLFLNGKRVRDRSLEAMKKAIDEILKGSAKKAG